MIRLGLVGATDPRHRWFLAAAERRRAGVRPVAVSDPDAAARHSLTERYELSGHADHREMLTAASPSMVAIALHSGAGPVVLDGLRQGADVIVAPPVCDAPEELDAVAELADRSGRRVIAAHTYRGHPASRVVKDLVDSGRLGRVELVALLLDDSRDAEQVRRATLEGLDLFRWLTDVSSGSVATVSADESRVEDPGADSADWGEPTMIATGIRDDGTDAIFEVRRRTGATDSPEVIQVVGSRGAVEWDVRTGLQRSAIDRPEPLTISCGRPPDPAEWVLTQLIRTRRPSISTGDSLATTRLLLEAEISRRRDGEPRPWQA